MLKDSVIREYRPPSLPPPYVYPPLSDLAKEPRRPLRQSLYNPLLDREVTRDPTVVKISALQWRASRSWVSPFIKGVRQMLKIITIALGGILALPVGGLADVVLFVLSITHRTVSFLVMAFPIVVMLSSLIVFIIAYVKTRSWIRAKKRKNPYIP